MSDTETGRKKPEGWVWEQAYESAKEFLSNVQIKAYMNNSAAVGVAIVQRYVAAFCVAWDALEAGKGFVEAKERALGASYEPPKNSPPLDEAVVHALIHVAVFSADALWHKTP